MEIFVLFFFILEMSDPIRSTRREDDRKLFENNKTFFCIFVLFSTEKKRAHTREEKKEKEKWLRGSIAKSTDANKRLTSFHTKKRTHILRSN